MNIKQTLDVKLLLTLVLIVNSCGYELRNYSTSLSNQVINYDATKSELNLELENQLNSKNYFLSRNADSDSRLKIISHSIEKFVGSTGQGARTTQVRLDYKLKYQIGNDYFIKVIKDINVGEEITLKYNWYNPVTDND